MAAVDLDFVGRRIASRRTWENLVKNNDAENFESYRRETISKAMGKARGEKSVFEAIRGGMGARAAWKKFGIM